MDYWRFPARLKRVVDGDTVDVTVDLGFNSRRDVRLRLADIDTAEIYGVPAGSEEYQRGVEHTEFVKQWFRRHASGEWPLRVQTEKEKGKYGRYIALIEDPEGDVLNETLVEEFGDEVVA